MIRFELVLILFMVLALTSCSEDAAPTSSNDTSLVGLYEGRYFGGVETIEMRSDHTFTQSFVRNGNKIYSHTGRWKFSPTGALDLMPFLSLLDTSGKSGAADKATTYDSMAAIFRIDPDRIELGAWPYVALKRKTPK